MRDTCNESEKGQVSTIYLLLLPRCLLKRLRVTGRDSASSAISIMAPTLAGQQHPRSFHIQQKCPVMGFLLHCTLTSTLNVIPQIPPITFFIFFFFINPAGV